MPEKPADRPTIAEIDALVARLRDLSDAGRAADRADVDRFLADKRELLDRITAAERAADMGALPEMPAWMREKAERAAAAYAAGPEPEGPVDDPARIAERIAALRAALPPAAESETSDSRTAPELHVHDAIHNHSGAADHDRVFRQVLVRAADPAAGRADGEDERRGVLNRLHQDDQVVIDDSRVADAAPARTRDDDGAMS